MNKLTVTLKQHTPLIHFQHNQEGATLRASEVKPKLDKYLIKHVFGDKKEVYKKYLIGNGDHPALDYKLRIIAESEVKEIPDRYPLFFGNMGEDCECKSFVMAIKPLKLIIFTIHKDLKKAIEISLADFFAQTNFGTRQSKGFGCFYIDQSDKLYKQPSFKLFFDIEARDTKELMTQISLFYNTLRAGINTTKSDKGIYFKSLMFKYAKDVLDTQWEKKTIKENFFFKSNGSYEGLSDQIMQWENASSTVDRESPLFYASKEKLVFKDLLGLSSLETWRSYNKSKVSKTEAKIDVNGNPLKNRGEFVVLKEREQNFSRIKSPLLFKVLALDDNKRYRVGVLIDQEIAEVINSNVCGKYLVFENEQNGRSRNNFVLRFPEKFNYSEFLNFAINTDINSHVEQRYHNRQDFIRIKSIYDQLKKNHGKK